jgi:2-polyprenyl-3-methyl-5-hydroxy-6-metoxy-1,4-benzoquinol methylase
MTTGDPADVAALRDAARAAWDTNAEYWDAQHGDEGNLTQRLLIGPAVERLLALQPGELVLDLACGAGAMARRMARLGAHVVAADFSAGMLERARARAAEAGDQIEFHQVDATDPAQLAALGAGRFDAAVCLQALMDMPAIEPALRALARAIKPEGRVVCSVTHPCFNNASARKTLTEEDRDGAIVETRGVVITKYITPTTTRGQGIIGQPIVQYNFDRPLSVLLGACFAAGFVLDAFEEPVFDGTDPSPRWYAWSRYTEIPPQLVFRLRLAAR